MKEKMKDMMKKVAVYKKKIIITVVATAVAGLALAGGCIGLGYYYAKNNENYSEQEARDIALTQVDGEIISVQKDFELEDDQLSRSEFKYEVEIKTADNQLRYVEVSSRTGTYSYDDDHYEHHDHDLFDRD
ncbi:MAG: PepSY domain-containing protein [Bacillus sp. (in: firmicutes)]